MIAWRVVSAKYAASAFDGEGARRSGGRFNSPGTPIVYAADTLALAVLEVVVHLPTYRSLRGRVAFLLDIPDNLVESLAEPDLPHDWRATPPSRSTQALGDAWVARAESPVLKLPSVLLPHHSNLLLNPAHPDLAQISISSPEPVPVDPRLIK